MGLIKRVIEEDVKKKFFSGKAILIVGARQVGKTTLCESLIKDYSCIRFNCDNPSDRALLNNKDINFLRKLIGDAKIVFIDEAQKVNTIGQTLKLMVDFFKDKKQILVSGSSSLNLLDKTEEPLTGRKFVFNLYPLSMEELFKDNLSLLKNFSEFLIFGSYPEVVLRESIKDKIELLKELTNSYLFKDVFEFQSIKKSDVIFNLLKALAFQLGNEVSYNELASLLGIDKKTVMNYINLLEKNFIVFRVDAFNKNKRNEISRKKKIYFFDLGVRNAIINNFNTSRNDIGTLFENFCFVERMKFREYHRIYANQYFWRDYAGNEIDLVEEREGKLFAYEFKYNKDKMRRIKSWNNVKLINKNNLFELFY